MKIRVEQSSCVHLKEINSELSDHYLLPIIINDCNIIHRESLHGEVTNLSIGILHHTEYEAHYYLHTDIVDNDGVPLKYFIFDSETINVEDKWT